MSQIKPIIDPELERHVLLWERAECYRYYVRQRRRHCTYRDVLDLWLRAPCCDQCWPSASPWASGLPDISEATWEVDLLLLVGPATLKTVKRALKADPEYAFRCKRCGVELRPWDGDDVYAETYHLEEHYGIPLTTPGRQNPSRKLRDQIFRLYGERCFGCRRRTRALHLDHIVPRALGGDAAFRNLQPLCERCGQMKGSDAARQVEVVDGLYFGPYPSDSYEGLFW
jgi:5-methylcytosine-specific restriction endonuclease McrA